MDPDAAGKSTNAPAPWLLASLGGSLLVVSALAVLLGLSYRREAAAYRQASNAARRGNRAERETARIREELDAQIRRSESLENRALEQGEALSALRRSDRKTRAQHRASEKELGELLRSGEDKSRELIRRHHRILELQRDVERLTEERDATIEFSRKREHRTRREYEAELRTERHRREELEEKLSALDEIKELRDRLRELVDALEQAVESR
jgi:hypothetical protein